MKSGFASWAFVCVTVSTACGSRDAGSGASGEGGLSARPGGFGGAAAAQAASSRATSGKAGGQGGAGGLAGPGGASSGGPCAAVRCPPHATCSAGACPCDGGYVAQGSFCYPDTQRHTGIWYSTWYTQEAPYVWSVGNGVGSTARFLADVNGDGLDDAVVYFPSKGAWYVGLSTGSGFGPFTPWIIGHGVGSDRQMMADVNGDGKADAVAYFANNGSWYVSLSTGQAFADYSLWIQGHGVGSNNQLLGDVNGDGKADAVVYFGNLGSWHVSLSTGGSFLPSSLFIQGHGVGSDEQFLSDTTGDGKADAVVYFGGTGTWYVSASTGQAFLPYGTWIAGHGVGSDRRMLGDIDGDGKADAIAYFGHDGDGATAASEWHSATSNGNGFVNPQAWKYEHGKDYYTSVNPPALPAPSTWQGLGAVYPGGKKAPVAFHGQDGRWKALPADKYLKPVEMNTWQAWSLPYRPLVQGTPGTYDSGDAAIIDEHLGMISKAGIDFLLFDLTNFVTTGFILTRAAVVATRIAAWNADPSHAALRYAVAIGGMQYTHDPATVEQEAAFVLQNFASDPAKGGPSTYFPWQGKPLLVSYSSYAERGAWEAWPGSKTASSQFTVRFAQGQVPEGNPPAPPPGDDGLYLGWGFPQGSLVAQEAMVVMPGHDNHLGVFVSRNDGGPGQRYAALCWARVLAQKPSLVVINSFNEFAEQTAVSPADTSLLVAPSEGWPSATFYWDQTVTFNAQFKP